MDVSKSVLLRYQATSEDALHVSLWMGWAAVCGCDRLPFADALGGLGGCIGAAQADALGQARGGCVREPERMR